MSGGFKILHGPDDAELSSDMHDLVSEIRVEQFLSKPAQFAIRFERDLCKDASLAEASMIPAGTMVTVQVDSGEDGVADVCLIRGPVNKVKSSQVLGGAGSWLEVHGLDRRAEMDRDDVTVSWTGKATDIVRTVLGAYRINEVDTGDASLNYDGEQNQLNQSGNDLKLIDQLARRLGYEFWFEYENGERGIVELAKFKPSPPRGENAMLDALPPLSIAGEGETVRLKVNVANRNCSNITAFEMDVDVERATEALIAGVDERTGEDDDDQAQGEEAEATRGAQNYADVGTARRILPRPGSSQQQRPEVEAVLNEDAWFVKASASTSVHLLKTIVRPHDIVAVDGVDEVHQGNYQVSQVVHVINDWGHLMDLKLRRNSLGSRQNG